MNSKKVSRSAEMVHVRGGFSDANGVQIFNTEMQLNEFDDRSRTLISNELYRILQAVFNGSEKWFRHYNSFNIGNVERDFCKAVINDVFCERNSLGKLYEFEWKELYKRIDDVIENAIYNEVLDILQYCCRWIDEAIKFGKGQVFIRFNTLFEREYIGYRFVDGRIVAITDKQEISAIETACNNPYEGCRKQLQKSVEFLADRDKKDYKNCIKESISAVESICQVIVGDEHATLSAALKLLEDNGVIIHPSLKTAFSKLYGYTSDQGGIRHAEGMFESNVTFEEAKFMLVSCSAFINYMIAEYGKRTD